MSNPFPFSPEVLPNYFLLLSQINCLHLLAWRVEESEESLPVVLTELEKEEDVLKKY